MRLMIAIGYGLSLAALVGIGYGTWGVYQQHRRITTSQPVAATVLGQRVGRQVVKGIVQFAPVVEYEYEVAGKKYRSDKTMPSENFGPQRWADAVLKTFPVGKKIQAFVDPRDPAESFLIPKYGPEPYLVVLLGVVFVCMVIGAVVEQQLSSDAPPQLSDGLGGTPLVVKSDHRKLERLVGGLGAAGLIFGAPYWMHYFHVSTPPVSVWFRIFTYGYNLAGCVLVGWALYSYRLYGGFGPTALEIDTAHPIVGRQFRVRLSQPVRFTGMVTYVTLRLLLEQKKRAWYDTSDAPNPVLHNHREILFEDYRVDGNEVLETCADFTLPEFLPSSTTPDDKSKTRFVWTLQLRGEASRLRKLKRDYVLDVTSEFDPSTSIF